jgi:iron-sulfur cluster repair protein YtfE (RIC family)
VCAFLGPREPTEREQADTEERVMTKVIALRAEHDALRDDVLRGFKIAHEVTLETQTVEEACSDLVRLVKQARAQRDDLWDQLVAKGKTPVQP